MIWILIVLLQTLILFSGTVWAADAAPTDCTLRNHSYQAQLVQTHLTGTVGEEVILQFTLDPPAPPQGFFLSVKIAALQEPEAAKIKNPEILTGFPETSLMFRVPGIYRFEVVVSLIAKSSCGGVTADAILNGEAQIQINP